MCFGSADTEERAQELVRQGHTANRWPDFYELAGHAHGITIDPSSGSRVGGADPRSDGRLLIDAR